VLAREDAITNWDQGCMRMPYLLSLVKEIGKRHSVIGADVTGDYSTPRYSGAIALLIVKVRSVRSKLNTRIQAANILNGTAAKVFSNMSDNDVNS
jgi:hypothetical protein